MFSLTQSLVFVLLAFLQPSYADYYIDDTNSTLYYYSTSTEVIWGAFNASYTTSLPLPNGTYMPVDPYACYNNTYRYAACHSSDNCILSIPFTGSGITIYVYQSGPIGINASFAVDGNHSQTRVLNAPEAPNYAIANVSMFNIQQLTSGPHTASLTVNNISGSYSGMIWDYAYVNETLITAPETVALETTTSETTTSETTTSASTASSSSMSSTSSTSSTSSPSHSDTGAIVSGVIGGIALIVIGVIGVITALFLRRRKCQTKIDLFADDDPWLFDPHTGAQSAPSPDISHNTTQDSTSPSESPPFVSNRRPPSVEQISGPNVIASFPPSPGGLSSRRDRKRVLKVFNNSSSLGHNSPHDDRSSPSSTSPRNAIPPSLTDEQADFINGLYNNDVPAAAVARVIERMLADLHAGVRQWQRELGIAPTAPPSYDLINQS